LIDELAGTEVIGTTGVSLIRTEELIAEPVVLLRTISETVDVVDGVTAAGIDDVAAIVPDVAETVTNVLLPYANDDQTDE
jgi:hypothetical protein